MKEWFGKIEYAVASIVIVLVGLAAGVQVKNSFSTGNEEVFGGSPRSSVVNLIGSNTSAYSFATAPTSSAVYVIGSTVDQVDMNIKYIASSTAELYWQQAFSWDANCASVSDATVNWYGEDIITASSTDPAATASNSYLAHSATTTIHTWVPESAGTHYKSVPIVNLNADCVRLTFFNSSSTDSSEIFVQVASKNVFGGR